MTPKKVYEWFKLYFPQYDNHLESWFSNGKNSIRIKQTNGQEFIFSYNSRRDWKFETIDSFLKGKRGGNANG